MTFVRLSVKTQNGIKVRHYKFNEAWIFGKFLCRYYQGKEYEWFEVGAMSAEMLEKAHKIIFKEIL